MGTAQKSIDTSRKIVIVGDGMVGKTALLTAFVHGQLQRDYIPTVFETSAKEVTISDGRSLILGLWDTGGQEEFDQIRQIAYPGASLILLCYAVDCPSSLENILLTWIAEVRAYCPEVPLLLVGCKVDLRHVPGNARHLFKISQNHFVNPDEAVEVCRQIGAHTLIECSAVTRSNVNTVFDLAARIILDGEAEKIRSLTFFNKLPFNLHRSFSNGSSCRHLKPSSGKNGRISKAKYFCFMRRR